MPSTDSEVATATLALQGAWIHNPDDPQGTATQYLYDGGERRTGSLAASATELRFAGRDYPVYSYGDTLTEQTHVVVTVPFGPAWATTLEEIRGLPVSRQVVCYRDGRGRRIFGAVGGYSEQDAQHGTVVSLTVERADFDEDLS